VSVSTRAIRTSAVDTSCDICGRTLLRGERAEVYLHGGTRHDVCELCTGRAIHAGWVREGTVPAYDEAGARGDSRRSLLGRLRSRRELESDLFDDELEEEFDDFEPRAGQAAPPDWPDGGPARADGGPARADGGPARPASERRPAPRRRRSIAGRDAPGARESARHAGPREPRHVRAVPTSVENKTAAAVSLFNGSEHPKTVAGIARSLGLPDVAVYPTDPTASVVNLVVSWELCWYRYQVELSDELPHVRVSEQGYELDELSAVDREINASADDRGRLALGG
jgi:hypothetical protein